MKKLRKVFWGPFLVIFDLSMFLAACDNNGGATDASSTEPYNIQIYMLEAGVDFTHKAEIEKKISKITKREINATVTITPVGGDYLQKINLAIASNEPLDLVYSNSKLGYISQVAKGGLLPLDDLLKKYGQGIDNTLLKRTFLFGHITLGF